MLPINITSNMSSQEILIAAHNITAIPSMIILAIVSYIILLIIGLVGFDTSHGRGKFFIVWLIAAALTAGLVFFLVISPNVIQNIWTWFN